MEFIKVKISRDLNAQKVLFKVWAFIISKVEIWQRYDFLIAFGTLFFCMKSTQIEKIQREGEIFTLVLVL